MYIDNLELARSKLNLKQQRFCEYYVACGNVYEAGLKAGYSDFYSNKRLHTQMKQEHYQNYIKELNKIEFDKLIANATEIKQTLTKILRGEVEEEVVMVTQNGTSSPQARKVKRKTSTNNILKAADQLCKILGLYEDKVDLNQNLVIFNNEDKIKE
ncbi:terminase small subunit [Pseudostreptobacillus hongkongensis]|uniref:terminase small subunit n=1 Tax=Pseudostreptobacillus hongkongensis TaxID=1162717 RepID=UPI00083154FE|nr:terminase small subunit [Pseudostreptobacillus hongkongensis]